MKFKNLLLVSGSILLLLPIAVQAGDYTYTTNSGTITITAYTGPGGAVAIPSSINSKPVTTIGRFAFDACMGLSNITIPNSVTIIGDSAFANCTNLTTVKIGTNVTAIGTWVFQHCMNLTRITIPNSVTNIGDYAFYYCTGLTSVTIGSSVTTIGEGAFTHCEGLTSVTIPNSVTSIESVAFDGCMGLTSVYFEGNAPTLGMFIVFSGATKAKVYYMAGSTGWTNPWGGRPTVLWNPKIHTSDSSFGVQSNRFGFNITGTNVFVVTVEACTNLTSGSWNPLQTGTVTNGSLYFSDPQSTNYTGRFYRLSMP